MAEVAHGQLAIERASNQEVKSFAQRMVDDHTKANQEIVQLASSKGISLPGDKDPQASSSNRSNQDVRTAAPTSAQADGQTTEQSRMKGKHGESLDRLLKLSGADFDREYIRNQLKDHEKAVALFDH